MTHTYYVKGMSCSGCEMTVKKSLEAIEGVSKVVANAKEKTAVVEMSQHVPFETLKTALEGTHYTLVTSLEEATSAAKPQATRGQGCITARCAVRETRPMTTLAIVLFVGWTWSKRSLPKASSRAIRRITSAKSYAANSGGQWLLPCLSSSSPWGGCGMTILCISSCH